MTSPSIIPNDRLDKDFYLVLQDFSRGPAYCETDEGNDHETLISDFLRGQYGRVLRVVTFNPVEGRSRDASEDIAYELETRIADRREVLEALADFIEGQLGRSIGVQFPLPLS